MANITEWNVDGSDLLHLCFDHSSKSRCRLSKLFAQNLAFLTHATEDWHNCGGGGCTLEAPQDTHGQDIGWGPPERNRQMAAKAEQGALEAIAGGPCGRGPCGLVPRPGHYSQSPTTPQKKARGYGFERAANGGMLEGAADSGLAFPADGGLGWAVDGDLPQTAGLGEPRDRQTGKLV